MAASDAQKRANAKYIKQHVKTINVRFYPKDAEVYERAKSQENASDYIRRLIREDMERNA